MANQPMEIITKVLEQSAKMVEEQVDAQLAKLNEMDEDDLERLKERRLEALKKAQKQKQVCGVLPWTCFLLILLWDLHRQMKLAEPVCPCTCCKQMSKVLFSFLLFYSPCSLSFKEWLSKGHGELREIPSEKDFFGEVKDSKNVVCHFYRNSTFR